jgi:exosortase/archaeosortase family protein
MSMTGAVLDPARTGLVQLRKRFGNGSPRDTEIAHVARTVAILLAAVVVAYHYSLSTLVRTVSLDTPLAYLGLVPVIALGLAALRARPTTAEPPIHDRQLDYIVAIPLLAASLLVNIFLPARLSAMFWVWRVDLLGLPLFVAGAITLLFGVRMLWRLRVAVAFLFLAWPFPYSLLLMRQLENFTNATVVGVRMAMHVIPVAHQVSSTDGVTFQIEHGAHGFPVSVASACSGVNGLVGYALLSAAFLALVKGSALRKIGWLFVGLLVTWLLNVVRIVTIFAVGKQWGQSVAIDGFHPFLGLVTFSIGVLVMLKLLGPFGLRVPFGSPPSGQTPPEAATPTPARRAVPRTRFAVVVIGLVAVVSGVANAGLRSFDLVANVDGTPRLASFLEHPARPDGWREYHAATYDWTRQFFGSDSNWFRFVYTATGAAATGLTTSGSVIADVINTSDLSSFSTYGIEACYSFHGYALKSIDRVKLGGVYGNVVSYNNTRMHSNWTNVYWIWPVKMDNGDTRYERVNLLMADAASVELTKSSHAVPTEPGHGSESARVRDFLVALARQIVRTQAPAAGASA